MVGGMTRYALMMQGRKCVSGLKPEASFGQVKAVYTVGQCMPCAMKRKPTAELYQTWDHGAAT